MDNASFHRGGRIQQIIESFRCTILYLPTYSPDFNPIEHCWFSIKNAVRRTLTDFSANFYDALCEQFEPASI